MLSDALYAGFPAGSPDDDHANALRIRHGMPPLYPQELAGSERISLPSRDFVFSRLSQQSDIVLFRSSQSFTAKGRPVILPDAGQRLKFLLHASPERRNPAIKHKCSRLGIHDPDGQRRWLCAKGAQHGFAVNEVEVESKKETFTRTRGTTDNIRLVNAWFDGVLTVTDDERFAAALRDGIGRRAAYGYGLLLFTPDKGH